MNVGRMIVVRCKTGVEYAYPESKFSDMPTIAIKDGKLRQTNFGRHDIIHMTETGNAKIVGSAKIGLTITYDEVKA